MTITYDKDITGHVAFDGPRKLAVITTKHHQGVYKNGQVIYEAMPRSSWTIHFTTPVMHVEELEAIMQSLPTEA